MMMMMVVMMMTMMMMMMMMMMIKELSKHDFMPKLQIVSYHHKCVYRHSVCRWSCSCMCKNPEYRCTSGHSYQQPGYTHQHLHNINRDHVKVKIYTFEGLIGLTISFSLSWCNFFEGLKSSSLV